MDAEQLEQGVAVFPEIAAAIAPHHGLSRLFVASGLSYPDSETGKVFLPSEIPPVPPGTGGNYRQKLVSKDDV